MMMSLLRNFTNRTPWFVANFDSCSALAKALGNFLHGKDFRGVGEVPNYELLAKIVNALPWQLQKSAYVKGSSREAVDPGKTGSINAEEFAAWVTGLYPKRRYPAIFIGSTSGAAVHVAAAMGVPWLPQTFMIPVKTPEDLTVDEPEKRMKWAAEPAAALLEKNPDLQLHHMMDPSQDRPMLEAISYFRVKRLQLGESYKKFISENLQQNGTIIIVDCRKSWPGTKVDDRHYFQFGGLGGISPEDYQKGSKEISEFLQRENASVEHWDPPQPDGNYPESEWGFEPKMAKNINDVAEKNNFNVLRLIFQEPEDLSPFVADLYRWWYRKRNITAETLLADMFFLLDPYWTIRTGSVPFWLAFNARPSVKRLKQYLQSHTYKNIFMLPFSNGVEGVGLATLDDLKAVLNLAKVHGDFIGSEPDKYPYDFGIYSRFQKDLKEKITSRYPMDISLTPEELEEFYKSTKGKYKVELS